MDSKICEKLIPEGIHLYQMLIDSDVSPVVHVLNGSETDRDMQLYFSEAGFSEQYESVVMGLALNGPEKQVVLIRSGAMHDTCHFLRTLWHELGHFSFRKQNPGIFFDLISDFQKVMHVPMMHGIVLKFWDEAIAQCASNRALDTLPQISQDMLCPDMKSQISAEKDMMHYFLKKCLNQGEIEFDLPLLNLLNIPFSPYCLAIYCAEAAANPWDDFIFDGCECNDCQCNMDLVQSPIIDLVHLVRQQYLSDAPFELSETIIDETVKCFMRLSVALNADDSVVNMMGMSLAEILTNR